MHLACRRARIAGSGMRDTEQTPTREKLVAPFALHFLLASIYLLCPSSYTKMSEKAIERVAQARGTEVKVADDDVVDRANIPQQSESALEVFYHCLC